MRSAEETFSVALDFLKNVVAPQAQAIDGDSAALHEVVDEMCRQGLMAMKRPERFGGPEMDEPLFRRYQEEVARTSGSLAFLTTQHQSAVSMIGSGENQALAAEYLPQMADGRKLVGIGFSQLRRSGPPIMRATETKGGYVLDGHVPWVTGHEFFPEFLIGASLGDGRSVFGVVPLVTQVDGSVTVSEPMRLAAMDGARTVTVDFKEFFLPDSRMAFIRPPNWIRNSDLINIALQGHFALGCARAGIDIVERMAEKKNLPFLFDAANALCRQLETCQAATAEAQKSVEEETTEERLKVRAWAIDLSVRCAHAAIAASSGAANSIHNPAQRVYREALVYTVSAQTLAVMEATMDRLTG